MVPIYAIDSFVSLRFKDAALYVDMLRDCYEGYALYLFLALMVGYIGDGDEYKVSRVAGTGAIEFQVDGHFTGEPLDVSRGRITDLRWCCCSKLIQLL